MNTAPPSLEVFTEPWARAWAQELASSDSYRQAAAAWEGKLALELVADPAHGFATDRAVLLDLWHGECRGAHLAGAEQLAGADYVLRAPAAQWKRVLAGEIEPIWGLMSGKLKLTRGNLAQLTRFVTASKELVLAATRIGSSFPAPPAQETSP